MCLLLFSLQRPLVFYHFSCWFFPLCFWKLAFFFNSFFASSSHLKLTLIALTPKHPLKNFPVKGHFSSHLLREKSRWSFLAFNPLYWQVTIPRSPQSPLLCPTPVPGSSSPSVTSFGSGSLSAFHFFPLYHVSRVSPCFSWILGCWDSGNDVKLGRLGNAVVWGRDVTCVSLDKCVFLKIDLKVACSTL